MITIIGVGHVFDIKKGVREIIFSRRPNIVCVELDRARYDALLEERKGGADHTAKAPVSYRLLSRFQNRLAEQYGGKPGDEMLAAIEAARELRIDVAFIDVEAAAVFNTLWGRMTFDEKVKLMAAGFIGLFAGKKRVEKELKKFDENRDEYMSKFGEEFPVIKKVLVDERDENMAKAIIEISKRCPSIVAVIGDGHIDGVTRILGDYSPEVIRLKELLSNTWSRETNQSMTVSFTTTARIG